MAKRKNARVSQGILKKDRQIVQAVLSLKDYNPANPDFTAAKLREAEKAMAEALAAEQKALEAVTRAREAAIQSEWRFHDLVLGAKVQVVAQYGDDSDEITKLGMKRKSERRYGRPRKTTSGGDKS
ncbi:MAG TPA: hypothetical protein DIS79_09350 [Bacteroidetes bacterium]|nr:hypothetical protein [Bacteroidota bacterium]HRK04980.1 hypothetical protein [Chlorobiota bacterium]